MENHFVAENVVAQAVVAPTYAPLALTGLQTGELFYILLTASVVRIFREDSD
jgi:hypothetical protein